MCPVVSRGPHSTLSTVLTITLTVTCSPQGERKREGRSVIALNLRCAVIIEFEMSPKAYVLKADRLLGG